MMISAKIQGNYDAMMAGQWPMPIGCPLPPDFALAKPGPVTCWVDYADGADANSGVERARPRRTIPRLTPGMHVRVLGGYPYKSPDITPIDGAGTAEAPAFVTGVDAEFAATVEVGRWAPSSYIVIDGVRLHGLRVARGGAHHICVRGCESAGGGIAFASYDNTELTDLASLANHVHHYGDWQSPTENDRHGHAIGVHVHRCWILGCEAAYCGGDGVQVNSGSGFSSDHVYIGGNNLHHNRENAWDVKQATHVVVSENDCTDHWPSSSSPGENANIHYGARKVAVLCNRFERGCFGLANTGCDELFAIGNEFADIRHQAETWDPASNYAEGAAVALRNSAGNYIYANTFRRCDAAIRSGSGVATVHVGDNTYDTVGDPPVRLETGTVVNLTLAAALAQLETSMGITMTMDPPAEPPTEEPPADNPPVEEPPAEEPEEPPVIAGRFTAFAATLDSLSQEAARLAGSLAALRDAARMADKPATDAAALK